jgi:hypothetical protein
MFWGKGSTSDAKLVHYCKVWPFLHGRPVELTIRGVLVIFEFPMSRKRKFLTLLVHVHMLKHRKEHLPPSLPSPFMFSLQNHFVHSLL